MFNYPWKFNNILCFDFPIIITGANFFKYQNVHQANSPKLLHKLSFWKLPIFLFFWNSPLVRFFSKGIVFLPPVGRCSFLSPVVILCHHFFIGVPWGHKLIWTTACLYFLKSSSFWLEHKIVISVIFVWKKSTFWSSYGVRFKSADRKTVFFQKKVYADLEEIPWLQNTFLKYICLYHN